jgi:hypothetical protein
VDVGLLAVLCVVRSVRLITHSEESYWMWCVWVWSWGYDNGGGNKIDSIFMFCPSFNSMEYYFFWLIFFFFFFPPLKVIWKFCHAGSVTGGGFQFVNSNIWCFVCSVKLLDALEKNTERCEHFKCVFTFLAANSLGYIPCQLQIND